MDVRQSRRHLPAVRMCVLYGGAQPCRYRDCLDKLDAGSDAGKLAEHLSARSIQGLPVLVVEFLNNPLPPSQLRYVRLLNALKSVHPARQATDDVDGHPTYADQQNAACDRGDD